MKESVYRRVQRGRQRAWSVWFVGVQAIQAYGANRNLEVAATLAFYGFLSLMPLLVLLFFLFSLVLRSSGSVLQAMANLTGQLFPAFNQDILADVMALSQSKTWGVVGILALVWSMTPFAGAIRMAMERIFRSGIQVQFVKAKVWNVASVLGILTTFVGLVGWKIFLLIRPLAERVAMPSWLEPLLTSGAPFGVTLAVMAFAYGVFSPVRLSRSHLLTGSLVTTGLLMVIRPLFGWFLKVNPDYGYAFGSLKAIFLLLIWVYYTFAAVLLGAEIIAAMRRKEALLLRGLFLPRRSGARCTVRSPAWMEPFTRTLPAGGVLFGEGEAGAEMFYVVEGTVVLSKGERELKTVQPGEFFGEMSMLLQTERTAGAVAGPEGARLVTITQDNFDMILRENPGVVQMILKEMATRLKATSAALAGQKRAMSNIQ